VRRDSVVQTQLLLTAALGAVGGACGTWFVLRRRPGSPSRALQEASAQIAAHESRHRAILEQATDVIALVDRAGLISYVSPAAERVLGVPAEAVVGTNPLDVVHPDDQQRVAGVLTDCRRRPGAAASVEVRVGRPDEPGRTLEVAVTNMLDDPAVASIVLIARDVTDHRLTAAELGEAQERFRSAFEHAPIGMALTSLDGLLFRVNRALLSIIGRAEDEVLGQSLVTLTHPADREGPSAAMERLLQGDNGGFRVEVRLAHVTGRAVWVSLSGSLVRAVDGRPLYIVSQVEDITERRAVSVRLAHQAIHDPLTGLPNRALFVDRLERTLARGDDDGGITAVLFLDIDRFKVVNDSLGHAAGDRLLIAIADRLRHATRPTDTVARFGGDEFTVLCTNIPDDAAARQIASRCAHAISEPVTLTEGEVFVTASVGIAIADEQFATAETMLRNADTAMYRAKEHGRARIEMFEPGAHHRVVQSLRTGNELHRAIERHELCVHYQPVVSLATNKVVGFEALVRWNHPDRGLVLPGDFIDLAEETGLIVPIGRFVLEEACLQAARWGDRGTPVTVSVNLSPRQLSEPALPAEFATILERSGAPRDSIWLEITESALMRRTGTSIVALQELRNVGFHLSIDDFGTGYSSLADLRRFPIEALKIDRAFVTGMGTEPEASAICEAILGLARALNLKVVAEGVETPEQLAALRAGNCDLAQGYLFGRPRAATSSDRAVPAPGEVQFRATA
jgi:diguanylate cyclase (GGDEF)-like protein/PAS domain S-box-containing protein